MIALTSRPGKLAALLMAALALSVSVLALRARPSLAAPAAPAWQVTTVATPTQMPAGIGQKGRYYLLLENVGAAESAGTITVTDTVSPGVVVEPGLAAPGCSAAGSGVRCELTSPVLSGGFVLLELYVHTTAEVTAFTNDVTVSGGGAPSGAARQTTTRVLAPGERPSGGIAQFEMAATGPAGEPDVQAAGHPTTVTTTVLVDNEYRKNAHGNEETLPVEHTKDLDVYLPLGFFGNPQLLPRCPAVSLLEVEFLTMKCPAGSRVGGIVPLILTFIGLEEFDPTGTFGLYNVTPQAGYAAELAFAHTGLKFVLFVSVVRHDGRYMLRVSFPGIPEFTNFVGAITSLSGDGHGLNEQGQSLDLGGYLTNPSACGDEPLDASLDVNSWEHPEVDRRQGTAVYSHLEGCELLGFAPSFSAAPESSRADSPSGYRFGVHVPQAPETFTGLGTPPLRNVSVTLPAGTSLSPPAANGLGACQEVGPHGIDIEGAESEEIAADGEPRPAPGHCPDSSRLGTISATTPLLSEALTGHIFLAAPRCGGAAQAPCTPRDAEDGKLFGLYLELRAPGAGVVIKLAGSASVDPSTGQITTSFDDAPQFPIADLAVHVNGGARAPLSNPQTCGSAAATGRITPWSSSSPAVLSSSFALDWDGAGGACPASSPFAPTLSAGTTDPSAGAYAPFTLTLEREDREQNVASLSTTLPPGLLAAVSHVSQCPQPQASQGACPASSRVGSTTVAIGSGAEPLYQSGQAFLTGPYNGAPFGLSVVVPAVAGPFDLGNVIVRAALYIDPVTARVTAVSGVLPQIIDGVPLRIRTINVTLDAAGFTLNPTDCAPMSVTGTIVSTQGAQAPVSSPFQARGCRNLPFKPHLSASTKAHTSRVRGASLTVKVSSAAGQANIGKVDLTLPKQLPSRNSTLKLACTLAQFHTNPAGCPEGSNIGVAKAVSPLLKAALTGPAYLVSHGGAAFPDVVFVLQGEGVRIELTGHTDIKKGITYSRFETVPDAPISTFETVLPQGPHSILGANIPTSAKGSLCGLGLKMPTTIDGQNGALFKQTTKIAVTGCPRHKAKARKGRSHR